MRNWGLGKRAIVPLFAATMSVASAFGPTGSSAHEKPTDAFAGKIITAARAPLTNIPGKEWVASVKHLSPGTVVPLHADQGDSLYFVVEGEWQMNIEGREPRTLSSGEGTMVPAGTSHSGKAVGPHVLRLLDVQILDRPEATSTGR